MAQEDIGSPSTESALSNGEKDRKTLIHEAVETWIRKLVDKSRRNNLLFFKHLKSSTLDLSATEPEVLRDFLTGSDIPLIRFLPADDHLKTASKAKEIHRRAVANLEERGLETLYLAFGMATWEILDGGSPPNSPVMLVPAGLTIKGKDLGSFSLHSAGEPQLNPILLQVLQDDYGLTIPEESILGINGDTDESPLEPSEVLAEIQNLARRIAGFSISSQTALANFSFQKMSMVRDMQEYIDEIENHDIIAALAGDNVAKAKIQSSRVNIDARSLDKRAPQDEFLIVDADSSQQCVIEAVANGQHGVIQGPPGTGKSQTIANLITALVAKGKRVLFVAEKRAALEVVLERLRKANLGHLALDLHGADVSRKGLMQQLANNWQTVQTSSEIHMSDIQRRYGVLREKLNRHAELMNVRRAPSGMSLFDIQGKLLQLPAQAISPVRWLGDELQALDQVTVQKIDDKLVELCSKASLFHKTDPSPWNGATLPDSAAVTYALQLVTKLDSESIPSLYATAQQLTDQTRLRPPTTLDEVGEITKLISEVATFLDLYSEEIFTLDLNAYLTILEPHQRLLSAVISLITNREYRQGVSILNSFRKKRAPSPVSLYKEVKAARDLVEKWQRLSDTASIPSDASSIAKILVKAVTIVFEDLDHLSTCFQGKDFRSEKFNEIREFMDSLKNDQNTPFVIPNITSIESRLVELGMRKFVDYLREKQPVPSEWKNLFHYAWLMSCYNSVRLQENEVAAFDGTTHDRFVEEFKRLDNERQNLNATNIRYVHAKNVIDVMNAYSAEASIVRNEMQKKARHLPLRKLIARAPHVLTTLCPCWMASPLSISQLIGAESQHFDVVLFDEASQVLPQDAVSAILRARQVVVAGDRHQLPPTSFFTLVEDDEDEREEACQTEGFESILDQMGGFLDPWYLQWHYRSRDETLIAFSNRHIYNDLLTTFPNSEASLSLQHVLVDASRDSDLNEDSPGEEVNKVVSLILEHAKERPNESLGVITLGVKHQRRIEEALDQALQSENGTIGFFDESRREKFFIKNLERVQGDERDAIILSIGYGKDASGKLPYRFGPILYEGGERRLNVAVTRARNRMTVVSSFSHFDMDPSRSSARGVELLRLYLQYAASVVRRKYTDS